MKNISAWLLVGFMAINAGAFAQTQSARPNDGAAAEKYQAAQDALDAVELDKVTGDPCDRSWLNQLVKATSLRDEALQADLLQLKDWSKNIRQDQSATKDALKKGGNQQAELERDRAEAEKEIADLQKRRTALEGELTQAEREPGREMEALDALIESKQKQLTSIKQALDNWVAGTSDGQLTLDELQATLVLVGEYMKEVAASQKNWKTYFGAMENQFRLRQARTCKPHWGSPSDPPTVKPSGDLSR